MNVQPSWLLMCVLSCGPAPAYSQTGGISAQSQFEVVSINPNRIDAANPASHIECTPGGRFLATNVPAQYVIEWAYDIRTNFSLPDWAASASQKYNIEGRASGPIGQAECKAMTRRMLEDRFQLKLHKDVNETNVYILTTAKSGAKLRRIDSATPAPDEDGVWIRGQKMRVRAIELWMLAQMLSDFLRDDRMVVDQTGLKGMYQFRLDFVPGGSPDLFTAIQEQLGLRLEPGKAPIERVVIDHLTKPSEN